jgi:alcohol dehydrogenase class IV
MKPFTYQSLPTRVVFGPGAMARLPAELDLMGARAVLVLCTARQRDGAARVAEQLGPRVAGIFDRAKVHLPLQTAEDARATARRLGADACVAIGGGSTIGLGKAIALTSALPILAIPTTFAGSEMTPIYGITEGGVKKTGRDPRVLPKTVLYDPELTATLPAAIAGPSGINAIAHAVEALYARDGNPIISLLAEESIRVLAASLPALVAHPGDVQIAADALYGAWLAGTCLGAVGMALHHKLCHTLGGAFNLPHAELHTIMLPHAVAYNRAAAPEAMSRISRALGGGEPAQALYDLARALGAPVSLADIGMPADGLEQAADLATRNPYDNPRPVERSAILALLQDAQAGRRPAQGHL